MKNQNADQGRRSILKGLMGIPVIAVAGFQTSAQAAMVDVNDPTAKALKYVETSTVDGSTCANCVLYSGGTAASGPCAIFPGKEVVSTGWCASYAKRP